MSRRIIPLLSFAFILTACGSMQRSDDAAAAKIHMVGMSREDVLACMGPPDKRAHDNVTEVWLYKSSDGQSQSTGESQKISGLTLHNNSHDKNFCTVDIVMKNDVVTRVNYNGPSDSLFASDEQCGYAIKNCVTADRF